MARKFLMDRAMNDAIAQSTQGGGGTWSKGSYLQARRMLAVSRDALGPNRYTLASQKHHHHYERPQTWSHHRACPWCCAISSVKIQGAA